MRRALLIPIVAVLAAAALAGCGGGGAKGIDSSVKANTSLLGDLPIYPHATLIRHATTGYTAGKAKPVGYQTRYIYRLPAAGTLTNVERFYLTKMQAAGWKQVASLAGPVVNYRKGDAFVSINLTQVKSHQLELVVDKGFFSHVKK